MSIPTKVVIIDDDKSSITVLANELKVYQDVVVVATASDSYDGEQVILKHKPQLIFLDIELPCISGLEFLATLHSKIDWDINIIFYTSYDKYMLQAFRMEAFDFLLKPINKDDLLLVMNRYYLNRKNAQPSLLSSIHYPIEKPLLLTTVVNDKIILRPQNIGYFRYNSERKLWEIVLDDFRHVILKHNTTANVILNYGTEFIQIHKTYIININYLSMIQENACIMLYPFNTVTELKVSKIYRKKLFENFYNL